MKSNIDYDATVQKFFKDVLTFLEKKAMVARDAKTLDAINKNCSRIRMIASNPQKFTNEYLMDVNQLHCTCDGFCNGEHLSVFQTYTRFIEFLRKYYELSNSKLSKEFDGLLLLSAYKNFKELTCNNNIRKFVYGHINPKYFAVKCKTGKSR